MTGTSGHQPTRTCVGCRTRCPASQLVRLAAPEGHVMVLPRGSLKAPVPGGKPGQKMGRGAWIHPRVDCVNAAVKIKAFARAFRRTVALPPPDEFSAAVAATVARVGV